MYKNKLLPFLLLSLVFSFFNLDIMNSLCKPLMSSMNISFNKFANISSTTLFFNIISLIFAGYILKKFNPLKVIYLFLTLEILCLIIFFSYSNTATLTIYRCSTGLLIGMVFPACMQMVSSQMYKSAGYITGIYGLAAMGSGIIAQNPVIFIIHVFNVKILFLIIAIAGILILYSSRKLFFLDDFKNIQTNNSITLNTTGINNVNLWLIALHVSLLNLPIFVIADLWSNLFLTEQHYVSENFASFITSMIFLGHILGSILLGIYIDKYQERKRTMYVGSMLAVFSFFCIYISKNTLLLPIFFLLLGIGSGAQVVSFSYVAISNKVKNVASATTVLSFFSVLAGAIFQKISGAILSANSIEKTSVLLSTNGYREIMFILFGCLILSLLLIKFIRMESYFKFH